MPSLTADGARTNCQDLELGQSLGSQELRNRVMSTRERSRLRDSLGASRTTGRPSELCCISQATMPSWKSRVAEQQWRSAGRPRSCDISSQPPHPGAWLQRPVRNPATSSQAQAPAGCSCVLFSLAQLSMLSGPVARRHGDQRDKLWEASLPADGGHLYAVLVRSI